MSEAKFTKGPWKVVGFTFSDCKEQNECGFIVRANGMCASKANARVAEAAPDMYAVASNFEIQGPDDDGMVWLVLHGHGTTGRAMVRIGHKSLICAQVALELEADRAAALRKARGEE